MQIAIRLQSHGYKNMTYKSVVYKRKEFLYKITIVIRLQTGPTLVKYDKILTTVHL